VVLFLPYIEIDQEAHQLQCIHNMTLDDIPACLMSHAYCKIDVNVLLFQLVIANNYFHSNDASSLAKGIATLDRPQRQFGNEYTWNGTYGIQKTIRFFSSTQPTNTTNNNSTTENNHN
jgi:hypothetical protein